MPYTVLRAQPWQWRIPTCQTWALKARHRTRASRKRVGGIVGGKRVGGIVGGKRVGGIVG